VRQGIVGGFSGPPLPSRPWRKRARPGGSCDALLVPRISTPVRNALAYAVPELFWGLAWASTVDGPLMAAFGKGFGGSAQFVGTASLLVALGLGIPMLLSAFWVEPMRHKRAFVFWGHVSGGVVMLGVALLLHLAKGQGDAALRVAYLVGLTLFFVSLGVFVPAWLALVGELFPARAQARVLGLTFAVNRVGGLVGGFWAHRVLAAHWSPVDQWTLLFAVGGAAALIGSLPFLWIVETPRPRPPRMRLGPYIRGLSRSLSGLPGLRRFILADLVGVTTFVTMFFYTDAALRRDGFETAWAATWVMVSAVAMLAMSATVAWLGERVRPRLWLVFGSLVAALGAVSAAFGQHPLAYGVAAAALGIYMALRNSCHGPQVMRMAPGRDGTAPIGIALALAIPVSGFTPYLAGLVIPQAGYQPVFLTVAVLSVLSAFLLLRWVPRASGNQVSGERSGPAEAQ